MVNASQSPVSVCSAMFSTGRGSQLISLRSFSFYAVLKSVNEPIFRFLCYQWTLSCFYALFLSSLDGDNIAIDYPPLQINCRGGLHIASTVYSLFSFNSMKWSLLLSYLIEWPSWSCSPYAASQSAWYSFLNELSTLFPNLTVTSFYLFSFYFSSFSCKDLIRMHHPTCRMTVANGCWAMSISMWSSDDSINQVALLLWNIYRRMPSPSRPARSQWWVGAIEGYRGERLVWWLRPYPPHF